MVIVLAVATGKLSQPLAVNLAVWTIKTHTACDGGIYGAWVCFHGQLPINSL